MLDLFYEGWLRIGIFMIFRDWNDTMMLKSYFCQLEESEM